MKQTDAKFKEILFQIYGENTESLVRYQTLTNQFHQHFTQSEPEYFTAPGRMELIGNHTDHNGGNVIAASIQMDTIGAAAPNQTNLVTVISEPYAPITIDLQDLDSIPANSGTLSLLAGILKGAHVLGMPVHGFDAYISTNVLPAAGVSSSASFEMLLCSILDYFFNGSELNILKYAQIGQYAERNYWNKVSGLMDQLACAAGGIISLDFSDSAPVPYAPLPYDFQRAGYDLMLIGTGNSHADLGQEYSDIPREMEAVAHALSVNTLSEAKLDTLLEQLPHILSLHNDRAILRSLHFYEENRRVANSMQAMAENNTPLLLSNIQESGNSSCTLLQNCCIPGQTAEQPIVLALALTKLFLEQIHDGCCRVHGGGFAGVILCILPHSQTEAYADYITALLPSARIHPIQIRSCGACHLEESLLV